MSVTPFFENIREQILAELNSAKKSIWIAMTWLTDSEIFYKLCQKATKNIDVKLILHYDEINYNSSIDYNELTNSGGYFFWAKKKKNQLHNKFCIVDSKTVLTGSYNWTYRAISNDEDMIVHKNENDFAKHYINQFHSLLKSYTNLIDKSNLNSGSFKLGNCKIKSSNTIKPKLKVFFIGYDRLTALSTVKLSSGEKAILGVKDVNEADINLQKDEESNTDYWEFPSNWKIITNNIGEKVLIDKKFEARYFNSSYLRFVEPPNLIPFKAGKLFGFCNPNLEMIIEPKYNEVNPFQSFNRGLIFFKRASVKIKNKWGLIDEKGNIVIECKFEKSLVFNHGLSVFITRSYNMGYIDVNGIVVPNKTKNEGASDYYTFNRLPVYRNGLWGLIDRKGEEVIPFKYLYMGPYSEGLAAVTIKKEDNKTYVGFIDEVGSLKISFSRCRDFNGIPLKSIVFSEGMTCIARLNNKIKDFEIFEDVFIDKSGRNQFNMAFAHARNFKNGIAAVNKTWSTDFAKWGFIDKEGKVVIDFLYRQVLDLQEGLIGFQDDNSMWGFLNKEGKIIIKPTFISICSFSEGYARIEKKDGTIAFIDTSGRIKIEGKNGNYLSATDFKNGLTKVLVGKNYFYVDSFGKEYR